MVLSCSLSGDNTIKDINMHASQDEELRPEWRCLSRVSSRDKTVVGLREIAIEAHAAIVLLYLSQNRGRDYHIETGRATAGSRFAITAIDEATNASTPLSSLVKFPRATRTCMI